MVPLFFASYYAGNGKIKWAKKFTTYTHHYTQIQKITHKGNKQGFFAAVTFSGKIGLDNTVFNSTHNKYSMQDILLMSFSNTGTLIKTAQLKLGNATAQLPLIVDCKTDNNGNLIVLLQARLSGPLNSYNMHPGSTVKNATFNKGDLILAKYNNNLSYVTHAVIQTNGSYAEVKSISIDKFNNIILSGRLMQTGNNGSWKIDFDPSSAVYSISNSVKSRAFFAKYTSTFNLTWAKVFKATGDVLGLGNVVDKNNFIY